MHITSEEEAREHAQRVLPKWYTLGAMPGDTGSAALEAQVAAVRRLGTEGRLRLAAEMSEDARRISIEGERRRHPELTEAEARRAVLHRLWGPELAARVSATEPRAR